MLPKVSIVGAGRVGSTCAYTIMLSSLAGEVAIANRTVDRARGEALDISHGVPLLNTTDITYGGYECCADAEVVVVTLGAAQKPGETRLDLTRRNADIFREVIPQVAGYAPDAVLLSAGFDAHENDLMSGTNLSTEGYEFVNDTIFELVGSATGGKVVSVLEGGYDLQILPVLVANHIRKMMAP